MPRDIRAEIHQALASPTLGRALGKAMATLEERRAAAFDGVDREALRRRLRDLKESALARNDELLARLTASIEERGGRVVLTADAEEARAYVTDLASARGVRTVVKSKSMVTEEIHLNAALEAVGIEVVETDLGERIIQLAGERPSHLITPAIHKTKDEIIALFAETMGVSDTPDSAEELTRLVRDDLRERFLRADMGITGANFLVAETGTVVIVENEGNARLCMQVPPVHVVVTGREKIVERLDDVAAFLDLLPRSATGQRLTSYVSFVDGVPSSPVLDLDRTAGGGGTEREFHLVIVDNGRSAAAADPELREALLCIRCGACLNACAPYTTVGGHVYGADPYPGGIGCAWTHVTQGAAAAKPVNGLCTLCARCTEVCPVMIDIPWLNTVLRSRYVEEGGAGVREAVFSRTDLLGAAGSAAAPVLNPLLSSRAARSALRLAGIDPRREPPRYERETFMRWWSRRGAVRVPVPVRRVALFVDCFVNHNLPQVGRAAVVVLERAGVEVVPAHFECCGRPAMSQGALGQAREWAATNVEELSRLIEAGHDVVCVEPSCLSALRDDYRRLLASDASIDPARVAALAEHTYDLTEYLVLGAREGWSRLRPASLEGAEFVVHGHCHQKALCLGSFAAEAVRLIPGTVVREVDALCCGMVGSFGYKREYAELSTAIGRRLFERLETMPGEIVACGISCRSQIESGTSRRVTHPIEVLERALR